MKITNQFNLNDSCFYVILSCGCHEFFTAVVFLEIPRKNRVKKIGDDSEDVKKKSGRIGRFLRAVWSLKLKRVGKRMLME